MKIFLNGQIFDEESAQIGAVSSGLYYGAGCFETLISYSGKFLCLEDHILRLNESLRYLGVSEYRLNPTIKYQDDIVKILKANDIESDKARVRIQISLNEKAGYGVEDDPLLNTIITAVPFKSDRSALNLCYVGVRTVPSASKPTNLKLSNMLHYRAAYREAKERGFDDGILLSNREFISETSIANLFWRIGDKIFTPSVECDLLPGITRKIVIGLISSMKEYEIVKSEFRIDHLNGAEEVWITNSVRELRWVEQIEDTDFKLSTPFSNMLVNDFQQFKTTHLK